MLYGCAVVVRENLLRNSFNCKTRPVLLAVRLSRLLLTILSPHELLKDLCHCLIG